MFFRGILLTRNVIQFRAKTQRKIHRYWGYVSLRLFIVTTKLFVVPLDFIVVKVQHDNSYMTIATMFCSKVMNQ